MNDFDGLRKTLNELEKYLPDHFDDLRWMVLAPSREMADFSDQELIQFGEALRTMDLSFTLRRLVQLGILKERQRRAIKKK